ncbi:phospholipase D-like domain-containing protein [Aestuariibaculum sp. M13]|uniref:phospholipase D-like domain-containing protein n=1 Tax=Aestuariibaculum sp. M13 TaxID=2967132 RepID=UPI002159EFEE|nr:phospholipase D-like domain-containing protein [Aestuariibaculum sp. M13]MCR8666209.1 phospholipase D-like domain-containing protein [Aestuariibaculum sp. M13]
MPKFLNTQGLNLWIPKLIQEAENELVLVVPYIKISANIFEALKVANNNGVIITIVYRENKLSLSEKEKLKKLNKVNLLHHPNIHCKCYYNGEALVIGSMNLYEYSEKNNREMGTLYVRNSIFSEAPTKSFGRMSRPEIAGGPKEVFDDMLLEIKEIINGASLESICTETQDSNFVIDVLKTDEDLEQDTCDELNSYFLNKKFKVFEISKNKWMSRCDNFFDKVDVLFSHRRVEFVFNLEETELEELHACWMASHDGFEFNAFKYYWNYHKSNLLLYKDNDSFDWDAILDNDDAYYNKWKEGINNIIEKYRSIKVQVF